MTVICFRSLGGDNGHQFVMLVTWTQTDIADFPPYISFKIVMRSLGVSGGWEGQKVSFRFS